MKYFLFALFLFPTPILMAQNFSISGKVVNKNKAALPGANVILKYPWGEEIKATVSDAQGNFELKNVEKGGYLLEISFLGNQPLKKEVTLYNQSIELGVLKMIEGSINLEEVKISGKIPMAQQKGDTTLFNADAFKTLPDANAQNLIEKLPGVVIEGGKIQAQGEDVKEVLVDGRPFFGNDPTTALRNLPAEVIQKIQIFDKKSDQTQFSGFDDGETSKTINIITRSNMRNGQFGKLKAGYGTDDKYQSAGNTSFFDGDRRISIIGQSNNVNQQNFATEDLLGVVGSNGGRRRGGRGGGGGRGGHGGGRGRSSGGSSVNDFLVPQQGGIAKTHAFGINYSDKWGEKMDISGSYFFNFSNNNSEENSNLEYIDSREASQFYTETNHSNTRNYNHRLNFRIEYQIDSANSIIMRPRLSFQKNDGLSTTFGETTLDDLLLNQTDNQYRTNLDGVDFSNNLLFRHRFPKRGRTVSLNIGTGYNSKDGNSFLNSDDIFFTDNSLSDTLDQFSNLDAKGWNVSTNISYTEPLSRSSSLLFSYRASWQDDDSDKKTFDYVQSDQAYNELNEQLTNVFSNQYFTQRVGGGYNFRKGRNFFFLARANFQRAKLTSDETFPAPNSINRTYYNVLPFAMLRFNFSRQENLRIFYRTNTQSPSVEQLQNVVDNSNPLQLSIGNPNLNQSYTHRLFARYSKTNTEKSTVFFAFLSGSYTSDYIASSIFLAQNDNPIFNDLSLRPGAQITQPVNVNGNWNLHSFITYGLPLKPLKTNLNLDITTDYSRLPGLIDERLNYSKNKTATVGITLASNISKKVDFLLSSRSGFNKVDNSLRPELDSKYLSQKTRARLDWILPKGIVFRTELTHQLYSGLSANFDENYFLWNVGLGKKLFKNQRGEISLSVSDLLDQNQSITRNVTEVYIEDLRTNVLRRYALLSFTYNFRNFNTGKQGQKEPNRENGHPFWRGF